MNIKYLVVFLAVGGFIGGVVSIIQGAALPLIIACWTIWAGAQITSFVICRRK